jgi:hypothetical protein
MPRRRVPLDIARALPELDAEARAFLEGKGQPLPAWIGLYRRPKANGHAEIRTIQWRRGAVLRGAEPVFKGALPMRAAIITDAVRLDATARYLMRLWMAHQRQVLAKRGNDGEAVRAAEGLWDYLLAHAPSADARARNIGAHNAANKAAAEKLKAECRAEAASMKATHPTWKKTAIAERLKKALGLKQSVRTIRRWL